MSKCDTIQETGGRAISTQELRALKDVSTSQWGIVTTALAEKVGVSRLALSRMADRGELQRISHGIYRLTDTPVEDNDSLIVTWISTDPTVPAVNRREEPKIIVGGMTAAYLWGCASVLEQPYQFYSKVRKQTQHKELVYHQKNFSADDVRLIDGMPVARVEFVIADLIHRDDCFAQLAEVLKTVKSRIQTEPDTHERFDWDYLDRHLGKDIDKEWFSVWERATRILTKTIPK